MKTCGQILNLFYQDMDLATSCAQIREIIDHEYIYDLEGTMMDFIAEFQEISQPMEEMLSSLFRLDDFGKILPLQESDEDDEGNLMYAIPLSICRISPCSLSVSLSLSLSLSFVAVDSLTMAQKMERRAMKKKRAMIISLLTMRV
jgi:hypothetical protein